jgi:hypothetical protein
MELRVMDRRTLADAVLVLRVRDELEEVARALHADLGDEHAAEAMRRWLLDRRPAARAALRRLERAPCSRLN